MNNVVSFEDAKRSKFQAFLKNNRANIYATTPKVSTISKDDEWINETEWDDLYNELFVKEN